MKQASKITGTWNDDPSHFKRLRRREFLQVGLVGGLGLSLSDFFRLRAEAGEGPGDAPAQAVIQIFLPGGMSAQETLDPKPYAPIEYRGPFGNIPTAIKGVRFGETLRETAKIADQVTIIRSMTHGEAAHERGVHNMFTGYRPSPAIQYPSMGSVVSHELGSRKALPPYVCIPNQPNVNAGSGYLSSAFGPFALGSDPAKANFAVRDLSLPKGISAERFEQRKDLLSTVNAHFSKLEQADALDAMDQFSKRAYDLISSQSAREAFDLSKEPDALKERYGRTPDGMRMLLARRLVESGVRFVSLTAGGWDHHQDISGAMRKNVPPMDKAFAMLIRDLKERGMLDRTLVLLTTEFGRTPKINKDGGRDHWPRVFSIAMAGAGIKKGFVYGASDATASAVDENPLSVENFAATVYNRLGIDPDKRIMSPGNRPVALVKNGQPVADLLA